MTEEAHHIARQAAALDDPRLCRDSGGVTDAQDEAPARVRVARDADGFWTCREAVSGSPEYVRDDLARPSQAGDERVARALAVVAGVLQGETQRKAGAPFSGMWILPTADWRGTVADALYMADAALAAMDTPKGGGDSWRPIETAPRDGTAFQARIPGHGQDNIIAWTDGLLDENEQDCGGWYFADEQEPPECWTDGVCWAENDEGIPSVQPTHWKPAPPAAMKDGG